MVSINHNRPVRPDSIGSIGPYQVNADSIGPFQVNVDRVSHNPSQTLVLANVQINIESAGSDFDSFSFCLIQY